MRHEIRSPEKRGNLLKITRIVRGDPDSLNNPRVVGFVKEGHCGVLREVTHGLANSRGKNILGQIIQYGWKHLLCVSTGV